MNSQSGSTCETDKAVAASASACIAWRVVAEETNKCTVDYEKTGGVDGNLPVTYSYTVPGKSGSFEGPDTNTGLAQGSFTIEIGESKTVKTKAGLSPDRIPGPVGGDISGQIGPFSAKATPLLTFTCNSPGIAVGLPGTS